MERRAGRAASSPASPRHAARQDPEHVLGGDVGDVVGPDPAGERLRVAALLRPAVEAVDAHLLPEDLLDPLQGPVLHRHLFDDDPDVKLERVEGGVVVLMPRRDVEDGVVDPDGPSTDGVDVVRWLAEDDEVVLRVVNRDAELAHRDGELRLQRVAHRHGGRGVYAVGRGHGDGMVAQEEDGLLRRRGGHGQRVALSGAARGVDVALHGGGDGGHGGRSGWREADARVDWRRRSSWTGPATSTSGAWVLGALLFDVPRLLVEDAVDGITAVSAAVLLAEAAEATAVETETA